MLIYFYLYQIDKNLFLIYWTWYSTLGNIPRLKSIGLNLR